MSTSEFAVLSSSIDSGDNRIWCMFTKHLIAESISCLPFSVMHMVLSVGLNASRPFHNDSSQ